MTGQGPSASITPTRDEVVAAFPDHPVVARALRPAPAPSSTGPDLTTVVHGGR